jgi:hypothetical protein
VDHRRSKNQLERFPVDSWDWIPEIVAFEAPLVVSGSPGPPPPPRRGFAIREPPRNPPPPSIDAVRPLVDPCLAASSLSFTAVSWASNLSSC